MLDLVGNPDDSIFYDAAHLFFNFDGINICNKKSVLSELTYKECTIELPF